MSTSETRGWGAIRTSGLALGMAVSLAATSAYGGGGTDWSGLSSTVYFLEINRRSRGSRREILGGGHVIDSSVGIQRREVEIPEYHG